MNRLFIILILLTFPTLTFSQNENNINEVKDNVPSFYDHQNPKKPKPPSIDSDFERHLKSQNTINHHEYLVNKNNVRRSHIKYMVNRKPFMDGADLQPAGKVASLAVESRSIDSHDDNVDRFTRECIRYIKEALGDKFEFLHISYLTRRTQDPRDPASFSVNMVTGLCQAVPKPN